MRDRSILVPDLHSIGQVGKDSSLDLTSVKMNPTRWPAVRLVTTSIHFLHHFHCHPLVKRFVAGHLDARNNDFFFRIKVVVENSGQRIIDAIQSYRSHFIAIDKDTGNVMVDPESSQEATEAVKHIITAAKSQIQEAVSGSTSFILSRIRDCLSSNLNDERVNTTATTVGSVMVTVSLGNGSSETFQAEVISVHQTQMEDPSDDKMVQMGEMPKQQTEGSWTTTATTAWESPMVINTRWTTATPLPIDGAVNSTVLDNSSATTASPNTTTSRLISWQDDIPKGSFPAVLDGNLNSESQLKTTETPVVAITERSVDILGNVTNVPSDFNTTAATSSLASTSTTVTTTILTQVPLIRRRIQQIKPIVSGKGSR
ncbi:hypothetical protein BV898_03347 [Hypsibius exemplaris]|uniref:Uncharacterized protein n=1 Tax=Hypsibius exemplaris TaxID=2072580 RepID=A0A1W0X6H1_HYPEX|nr:hypothetical protein BV898_03347 [Hypsibius exemplaris]